MIRTKKLDDDDENNELRELYARKAKNDLKFS